MACLMFLCGLSTQARNPAWPGLSWEIDFAAKKARYLGSRPSYPSVGSVARPAAWVPACHPNARRRQPSYLAPCRNQYRAVRSILGGRTHA
jgi:hypothetical protein